MTPSPGRVEYRDEAAVVRRHQGVGPLRSEVRRMEAAREVSDECGEFRVPRILEVHEKSCRVSVEYIPNYTPLGSLHPEDIEHFQLPRRVGRVLRQVHAQRWTPGSGASEGLFHGDFDPFNVGVDSDGHLVLIDWDPAPTLVGCPITQQEKDVGMFVYSLLVVSLHQRWPLRAVEIWAREVLSGYGVRRPTVVQSLTAVRQVASALRKWEALPPGPLPLRGYYWLLRSAAARTLDTLHSSMVYQIEE